MLAKVRDNKRSTCLRDASTTVLIINSVRNTGGSNKTTDDRVPLITCRQSVMSVRIMLAESTDYWIFHVDYVTLANDDTNQ